MDTLAAELKKLPSTTIHLVFREGTVAPTSGTPPGVVLARQLVIQTKGGLGRQRGLNSLRHAESLLGAKGIFYKREGDYLRVFSEVRTPADALLPHALLMDALEKIGVKSEGKSELDTGLRIKPANP